MGRAVAGWDAHQTDESLTDYDAVLKAAPEWRNPQLVKALYSPGVAESVREIDAELRKRLPVAPGPRESPRAR